MFIYLCMYTTYMNNVLHGSSCIKQAYTLTRVAAGEDPVWQPELVFGTEMSHTLFVFPTQVCTWVISHSGQKKYALLPVVPEKQQCLVFIFWSQGLEHGSCKHIGSKKA
jgi:hypothetical protein